MKKQILKLINKIIYTYFIKEQIKNNYNNKK